MKFDIIFENDFFVAVNKPAGLLSIPDRDGREISLKVLLIEKYQKIFTVHRLDKDTSGIIVFAKDAETHKQLSQIFESRNIEKLYLGLVHGTLLQNEGTIDVPIMENPVKKGIMLTHQKGKPAVTDYKVLENFKQFSWVQFHIHTGRTHQIRVHCKHIGNSLVCDEVYGDGKPVLLSSFKKKFKLSKNQEEEKPILSRLALHSWKLNFALNEKQYSLEAPLPKDLKALLQQLRKWQLL
jgi:23S rRNA pseudouridine955/2504/2580 synthase/23S rRNA pseudouridine1911/1915/1917 synthase